MVRSGVPLQSRKGPVVGSVVDPQLPLRGPNTPSPGATLMAHPGLGPPVVTFDKGGRVPRLEEGTRLDGRQTGILFAQLAGPGQEGRQGRLLDWDRDKDPAATARVDALVAQKGPEHKQTLLIALSMGVLRRFEVIDPKQHVRYQLEGDRGAGYAVVDVRSEEEG